MARKATIRSVNEKSALELRLVPVKSQSESLGKSHFGDASIFEMLKAYTQEALEQYANDPMKKLDALGKLLSHGKKAYDMEMRLNKKIEV